MSGPFPTLVHALRERALGTPGRLACVFLADGEEEQARLTYGALDARARAIAAALRRTAEPGDRALLLYPPGLEFVEAFLGCLYAGVVAVPSYPPGPVVRTDRGQARLRSVAEDSEPRLVLAPAALRPRLDAAAAAIPALSRALVLVSDEIADEGGSEWDQLPAPDDLAFLQYTSGSTSEPKGVEVTHGNLAHNEEVIRLACAHDEGSTFVSWLPIYHDMGLIGSLLQPLWVGAACVLMAPVAFLQKPERWLRAISRWRAHTSGAPDFAFDLCVRKIPAGQRAGIDLSSWRVAFDGSEPVRARTLQAFAEAFGPCGFRAEAFFPCYGLAEATLIVSGARERPTMVRPAADGRRRVGCGPAGAGLEIAVVDPETFQETADLGEIWVAGPSVARGYWRKPELTAETFGARLESRPGRAFLRTGDLGFLDGGELFVAGRLKDLIIVRGRNHYPQDLELTAAGSHPALRDGAGAAFSVESADGTEAAALVLEVDVRRRPDPAEVLEAARRAVAEEHEVPLAAIALVRPGRVPRTTSGKVRRRLCRELFLAGALEPVAEWRSDAETDAAVPPEAETDAAGWLRARLAAKLGVPAERLDPAAPLARHGLDSLAAVELAHEIEGTFRVDLPLVSLLEGASLAELARRLTSSGPRDPRTAPPRPEQELTAGERALWLLQRSDPESPAYNLVGAARLTAEMDESAEVDEEALRRAFTALAERHPALRTTFASCDGEPVRRVHPRAEIEFAVADDSAWNPEEIFRPFDLEAGPLLRVALVRRSPRERVLILNLHHIVADFWSLAVLVRELGAAYSGASLPPAPAPEVRAEGIDPEREAWWRARLEGYPLALDLPTDLPTGRPDGRRRHRAADLHLGLGAETSDRLRALGRGRGATLFVTLLAAFQTLLHRVTGQDRLLVGSPTAGRDRAADAGAVAYRVNPVVLASDAGDDPPFADFLDAARHTVLEALDRSVPFPLLVERLQPDRDPSRSPIFQAAFALQRAPHGDEALGAFALAEEGGRLETGGLTLESMALPSRPGQFDLTLLAAERGGEVRLSLLHDLDLFDRATADRLAGSLLRLAEAVAADPGLRVSEIPVWSEAELRQVWSEPLPQPDSLSIPERVARQARLRPDAVAVSQGGRVMTYGELMRRSDALARRLRSLGAGPDVPVAVLLERSPEQVVALLAVLRAGAAYLPVDPATPRERAEWMVADAGALMLPDVEAGDGTGDLPPLLDGQLAYVIYTSGSTGQPKGVAVSHAALRGLVDWHLRAFGVGAADVASHVAGLGFDASVWEVWPCLAAGARLALPDEEARTSPEGLRDWLLAEGVTVAFVPTALAEPMLGLDWPAGAPLRALLTGGDRLAASPPAGLPFAFWNNYGPTECAVVATSGQVEPGASVPDLGRPIDGVRVQLLDRALRPVPAGPPGEIGLAGSHLARGYLGRPDLTAERFIPDPSGPAGARLYRTGDLGRWTPDGRLRFLGRIDRQVQIRGVRVEPGEVEAALLAHPDVEAAAVVPVPGPDGGPRLDAFAVVRSSASGPALREHLRSRLPAAMVPAVVHVLPSLPLTANGKLDRAALAKLAALAAGAETVPPRTPREELLAGIWTELLGTSAFGVHDDFFALGGHSLLASRVASRVWAALGAELPLRTIFETPTIAGLAACLENTVIAGVSGALALEPVPREGDLPLSFAQRRLWFLQQLDPGGAAYNVAGVVHLKALTPGPSLSRTPGEGREDTTGDDALRGALECALLTTARRQEALRTTFHVSETDGQPVQRVAAEPSTALPLVDLGSLADDLATAEAGRLAVEEARRPFDLRQGPLLRTALLRLPDGHRLVVNLHHIVADGWSLGVLLRELGVHYAGGLLPALPLQVADFAVWQRRWMAGDALDAQLGWWRGQLDGMDPVLQLPADRTRPARPSARGGSLRFDISGGGVEALEALGRRAGASLFMVLLAGWKALLHRYTGRSDLAVGSPVAGRGRVELEELIGCFVNTLVLRTRFEPEEGFRGLTSRVKETALGAFEHQEVPFERLVEELQPGRDLAHTPLFQVVFALQNNPRPTLELPGLALEPQPVDAGAPKFDLTLSFEREDDRLAGILEYRSDLFDAATISRLARHLDLLLASAAVSPDAPLGRLPMLADEERAQLLSEWNPHSTEPVPGLLHERFEAWVDRAPDAAAVSYEDAVLSYRELDDRANRLAHHLLALGVKPGDRVAVWLERSVEVAVAILGTLKAGAAWLPLDPSYPLERLAYMAVDGAAAALVTTPEMIEGAAAAGALPEGLPRVLLGRDEAGRPASRPGVPLSGAALAYVLYTSGSTGRPKGVCCHHAGVLTLFEDFAERAPLPPGTVCSLWASLSFDASVFEVFSAWLTGGRLEIVPERVRTDGRSFAAWMAERRVGNAYVTPAMLVDLAEAVERLGIPLRRLFVGVEPIPEPLLAGIAAAVPGLRVLNAYGPTESTVCATMQAVAPPALDRNTPIGLPVRGSRVHALGPDGELVPVGVPGEVCIAGAGLAWGYLGRPDLTAARFVPDPYGAPGGRLYRTGDLARRLPDGSCAFLGRIDHQVKIRGVRVEPAEVEVVLRELPGVRDATVAARRDPGNELRLIAWVVLDDGSVGPLREALRSRLPEVMVPAAFVRLDALPLTVNGKTDLAALPDPDWRRLADGAGFVPPRTMVEEMLAAIWAELLGLDRVGVHDSFFDLGGHSLKAGQLVLRVRDAFGVDLPVRTVFEAPTVAAMAVAVGVRLVEQADPETLAQALSEL